MAWRVFDLSSIELRAEAEAKGCAFLFVHLFGLFSKKRPPLGKFHAATGKFLVGCSGFCVSLMNSLTSGKNRCNLGNEGNLLYFFFACRSLDEGGDTQCVVEEDPHERIR